MGCAHGILFLQERKVGRLGHIVAYVRIANAIERYVRAVKFTKQFWRMCKCLKNTPKYLMLMEPVSCYDAEEIDYTT